MKKGVKILGITLLVLLLIIIALPVIFKKQISERVKQEINSQINGQVDYKDLSFSFLSNFPNPTISLEQFSLTGGSDFNGIEIASVKKLGFSVDLMSVLQGHNYRVLSFNVADANFNLKVNKEGKTDWDVMKYAVAFSKAEGVAPGKKQADFSLQVNSWKVENTSFAYANDTSHTFFEIKDLNAEGSQILNRSGYQLKSNTEAKELSYTVGGISYFSKTKVNADIHFTSDPSTGLYSFSNNIIQLNGLHLKLDGTVKNSGVGQDYNLKVVSADTTFKTLLSVVPVLSQEDTGRLNATGGFAFSGTITGHYHENQFPAITALMSITNGTFQQQGLPMPIKNISVVASVVKPQGPFDSAVIEVSRAHVETGRDSVNAKLRVTTPVSNADIEALVVGSLDPALIPGLKPNETDLYSGLRINLKIAAHKNDVANNNYRGAQATGGLTLLNCSFQAGEMPMVINIGEADCSIRNGSVVLDKLAASLGRSNFNGNGTIDHLFPWLSQQSRLAITLNLRSDAIFINELMRSDKPPVNSKPAPATTNANTVHNKNNAFGNVDVIVNAIIKGATYNQLVLQNLNGQLQLSDDNISLRKATAALGDGGVSIAANSTHIGSPAPLVNFNIGFTNISMQQVNKALKQGGVEVSSLQNINGNFSGELKGNGMLNADKSLNYRSIHADGKTTCPDLRIDELPVLMDIARMAKVKSFEHMEAKNILCNFHFNNGKTTVDPTDIRFTTGTNINFKGVCDANQNVDADIALDVPVREFGQVGSLAQSLLGSFMKMPENMQFKFKITGPMNKPAVNLASVGTSGN